MKPNKSFFKLSMMALTGAFLMMACNNQTTSESEVVKTDSTTVVNNKSAQADSDRSGEKPMLTTAPDPLQVLTIANAINIKFSFNLADTSISITYNGNLYSKITAASSPRQWFFYTDPHNGLCFVDQPATVTGTIYKAFQIDSAMTMSITSGGGNTLNLIGNGDARGGGSRIGSTLVISGNTNLTPTSYTIISIPTSTCAIKENKPS